MFIKKKDLEKKVASLEEDVKRNEIIKNKLEIKIAKLDKDNKKIKKELMAANKLLREQTEADILLNALKAVGIIRDEKAPEKDYIVQHNNLLQQLSHAKTGMMAQRDHAIYLGLGNILGLELFHKKK